MDKEIFLGILTPIIGLLIWLIKKYVTLRITIKKVEKETNDRIMHIESKITLVIKDEAKALSLLEIVRMRKKILQINDRIRDLEIAPKGYVDLTREIERFNSLFKQYHEVCFRFHDRIQRLLNKDNAIDQQIREINLKLATIKRL